MEHTKAIHTLTKPGIVAYFRYVDDILHIYNKHLIDNEDILSTFNSFCPSLQFTLELEKDNKLNFLDITIERTNTGFSYNIYRKATTTDTIIPMDSNHPLEHKMAAIRYLLNRANKYNLHPAHKQSEMDKIMHILHNNMYKSSIIDIVQRQKQPPKQTQDTSKQKWAKFTYSGKITRTVTKFFQQAGLKIAYSTKNNLGSILRFISNDTSNKYTKSGIYQLTCPSCNKTYTGQTGRSFQIRFREHKYDFKYMHRKSKYAQHLLDEGHSFGPMEETMHIIQFARKGRMMNVLENFHIYDTTKRGIQINDRMTVQKTPIFDTILRHTDDRRIC